MRRPSVPQDMWPPDGPDDDPDDTPDAGPDLANNADGPSRPGISPTRTTHARGGLPAIHLLLSHAPTRHGGFVRVPNYLIHGNVFARLEKAGTGLGVLLLVCLRHADQQDHIISASKVTLCRECGVGDARTLDHRLKMLHRGNKKAGIPPLLKKLPGKGVRYTFRQDGIDKLAGYACDAMDALDRAHAAQSRAKSMAGKKGMRSRWGTRPR